MDVVPRLQRLLARLSHPLYGQHCTVGWVRREIDTTLGICLGAVAANTAALTPIALRSVRGSSYARRPSALTATSPTVLEGRAGRRDVASNLSADHADQSGPKTARGQSGREHLGRAQSNGSRNAGPPNIRDCSTGLQLAKSAPQSVTIVTPH